MSQINVPNIQQIIDSHLFDVFDQAYGSQAPGFPWIQDPDVFVKGKYSVVREYRNLPEAEMKELIKTKLNSVLGSVIITMVRMVNTPRQIKNRVYGSRLETIVYLSSQHIRNQQLGGKRVVYEMTRDLTELLMNNPVTINGVQIPFLIQTNEPEFSDKEIDIVRMILQVPQSEFGRPDTVQPTTNTVTHNEESVLHQGQHVIHS